MHGKVKKARRAYNKARNALIRADWLHLEDWIDEEHPAALLTENPEQAERLLAATEEKVQLFAEGRPTDDADEKKRVDLQQAFKSKFSWYLKVRDVLLRHRIRMHLFSGIEFQMFIFIIAPIIGFIPEIILASSILLFLFELSIIYKLWLSTKDFEKELAEIEKS